MTKKKKAIQEIDLNAFTDLNSLEGLSGSDAYICDVETGLCGPIAEEKNETIEEKKNENNSMV